MILLALGMIRRRGIELKRENLTADTQSLEKSSLQTQQNRAVDGADRKQKQRIHSSQPGE
jgi:hypothetical protein